MNAPSRRPACRHSTSVCEHGSTCTELERVVPSLSQVPPSRSKVLTRRLKLSFLYSARKGCTFWESLSTVPPSRWKVLTLPTKVVIVQRYEEAQASKRNWWSVIFYYHFFWRNIFTRFFVKCSTFSMKCSSLLDEGFHLLIKGCEFVDESVLLSWQKVSSLGQRLSNLEEEFCLPDERFPNLEDGFYLLEERFPHTEQVSLTGLPFNGLRSSTGSSF